MQRSLTKMQRGFSLVTAIFLLVVLSALGTLMVTFFAAQQQSSALDVQGARAYQAARAGIEWAAQGVSQTAPGTLWVDCKSYSPLFAAGTLGGTLAPFSVTLTCASTPVAEGSATIYVYSLTAAANTGGTPGSADYVERSISVTMGR